MKKLIPFLFIFFVACTGDKVLINSSDIKSKTKMIDFIADETKQDYPQTTKNMEKIKLITPEVNKDADNLSSIISDLKKSVKEKDDKIKSLESINNKWYKGFILGGFGLAGLGFLILGLYRGGVKSTVTGAVMSVLAITLGTYWEQIAKVGIIIIVIMVVVAIVLWWETRGNKKEVFTNYG